MKTAPAKAYLKETETEEEERIVSMEHTDDKTRQILACADRLEPELIRIRRELHRCPELARHEYRTSGIIARELRMIPGMEVYDKLAQGTGVMGILRGKRPGRCILLRADIDALPVEEPQGLPFRSEQEGCMHACGHDAHAAWILGAGKILASMREELPGTVKFVFQPGEEKGFGARELILEDKVLENPAVDFAFAAHAWPSIDAGRIGIARNYAFGCPGGFSILVRGKGGHGSWPHLAVNPVTVASHICTMLPQILSDRIDGVQPRVITVCGIHAGVRGVGNIIPDECQIDGTIRAVEPEVARQLKEEIERVVQYCCGLYHAEYTFQCHYGNNVKNDRGLVQLVQQSAARIVGEENAFVIEEDNLGGENFSEFSSRVPSCYMFVGIRNEALARPFALHSPEFMLDESVLAKAAAVFARIVFAASSD